jgi:hypothetical protein
MAAYSKLLKTGRDWALGFQSINTAISNLEALYSAWISEHGNEDPPAVSVPWPINPYEVLGHHNIPQVPRAIVKVQTVTIAPGQTSFTVVGVPVVRAVNKLAVGQYQIVLDPRLYRHWGAAWPSQTSAQFRFCKPVSYFPSFLAGIGSQASVIVSCYDCNGSGGAFALTDFEFCCAIYGYTAAQATPPTTSSSASVAKKPARPPPSPRTRLFGRFGSKAR